MMKATIKITQPGILWLVMIEPIEDELITTSFTVYTKSSAETIECVNMEYYWTSISAWENDTKKYLEQIIKGKNVILECHIRSPRYLEATESEKRVHEVICQILGIPYQ